PCRLVVAIAASAFRGHRAQDITAFNGRDQPRVFSMGAWPACRMWRGNFHVASPEDSIKDPPARTRTAPRIPGAVEGDDVADETGTERSRTVPFGARAQGAGGGHVWR